MPASQGFSLLCAIFERMGNSMILNEYAGVFVAGGRVFGRTPRKIKAERNLLISQVLTSAFFLRPMFAAVNICHPLWRPGRAGQATRPGMDQ